MSALILEAATNNSLQQSSRYTKINETPSWVSSDISHQSKSELACFVGCVAVYDHCDRTTEHSDLKQNPIWQGSDIGATVMVRSWIIVF